MTPEEETKAEKPQGPTHAPAWAPHLEQRLASQLRQQIEELAQRGREELAKELS